jgi:hypothetical protein
MKRREDFSRRHCRMGERPRGMHHVIFRTVDGFNGYRFATLQIANVELSNPSDSHRFAKVDRHLQLNPSR